MMPGQRRGRAIAMNAGEMDAFLREQRTCRVATLGPDGPHVSPVWFVWDADALWIYSLTRSQRWADVHRDPRVAVVVDAGEKYAELHGVERPRSPVPSRGRAARPWRAPRWPGPNS
jgi:nitroimidazol reductase NimA-like FMN-containing flavoprotein (pyridoxamine 5'-phosphate oxidase superfamily)